jgi:pilus assembly protein Flp/PilA
VPEGRGLSQLTRLLHRLASDQRGATAIEYTLLAALIGAAAIFGFDQVGQSLENIFVRVSSGLPTAP